MEKKSSGKQPLPNKFRRIYSGSRSGSQSFYSTMKSPAAMKAAQINKDSQVFESALNVHGSYDGGTATNKKRYDKYWVSKSPMTKNALSKVISINQKSQNTWNP